MGAQVIRPGQFDRPQHGQNALRPQLFVMSRLAARTGNRPPILIRRIVSQQLRQRSGSSLMHRRANDCLDSLEVQTARLSAVLKDGCQQPVYLRGQLPAGSPPPFFFLRLRHVLFDWPQTADLSANVYQFSRQGLEFAERRDLTFRFADDRQRRQILCYRFATDFLRELGMRPVSGIV